MADHVQQQFLPIGPMPARPKGKTQGGAKGAESDREADPNIQRARRLGDYAWKVIDQIAKDYNKQIGTWNTAFKEVLAAFATAIQNRDKTFERAKDEREREAAFNALLLS